MTYVLNVCIYTVYIHTFFKHAAHHQRTYEVNICYTTLLFFSYCVVFYLLLQYVHGVCVSAMMQYVHDVT